MLGSYSILEGDCLDVLRTLPSDHFHCVVTSPPYWNLRDYQVDGQIGLEQTPADYIAKIVAVFQEVRRVLRGDGVCFVNLGDSYASNQKGSGGATEWAAAKRTEGQFFKATKVKHGLKEKDLVGIPWRVAFALQADGWWLRQDIIWHKPNPMPESVTDRCTKAHEYIFMLTKSARYFWDQEAVREKAEYGRCGWDSQQFKGGDVARHHGGPGSHMNGCDPSTGRNLRSVWTIPSYPYSDAHFATYPPKLVEPCVKAGTSEKGCCGKCGAPNVRVTESQRKPTRPGLDSKVQSEKDRIRLAANMNSDKSTLASFTGNRDLYRHVTTVKTAGWQPGCECNADVVPCRVLDPFNGSGTTGLVACGLGRDYIGIELNPEYAKMARKRIAKGLRPASFCDQTKEVSGGLFG